MGSKTGKHFGTYRGNGEIAMRGVTVSTRAGSVVAPVVLGWIPILNAATDSPSTERTVNTLLAATTCSLGWRYRKIRSPVCGFGR